MSTRGLKMPLSPRASLVIQYAEDVAREWGNTEIGPHHIMLGIIREGESIPAGVLDSLQVSGKVDSYIRWVCGYGERPAPSSEKEGPA